MKPRCDVEESYGSRCIRAIGHANEHRDAFGEVWSDDDDEES